VYAILQASILPLIWRLETKGLMWRMEESERVRAAQRSQIMD
jgi:hypothetical protein